MPVPASGHTCLLRSVDIFPLIHLQLLICDDAVGIATRLQYGRYGGSNPVKEHSYFYSAIPAQAMGPAQPSVQWVLRFSSRVKRSKRDVDHYPPSRATV